jgi:hypothetical protein
MLSWFCCFVSLGLGVRLLAPDLQWLRSAFSLGRERGALERVTSLLLELEETLASGLLPQPERWEKLKLLPTPWGRLSSESLEELRSHGGALLPTLKRLRQLAEAHLKSLSDCKARASQAMAQASACAALVPLFSFTLYFMLPGVSERPFLWGFAGAISFAFSLIAVGWMLGLAENARWGGIASSQRGWILASQCAGERFLALIRCGDPADVAWTRVLETLAKDEPELAEAWGYSIWASASRKASPATQGIIQMGISIRKSVQLALMEGFPCTERVEVVLQGSRQELSAQMDRELNLLGTRCLVPLSACVAPSLLGLLAFGLYLGW